MPGTGPAGEIARPWIIRGAVVAGTAIARRLLQRRVLQEVAEFGLDEATNDFPLKRCIDGFSDPCRAGSMPDACYDFLMTHGPGWAMKPLKRLMDRFLPNLGFPGMGVDDSKGLKWPKSPEEMDKLLGVPGKRVMDTPSTKGRNKVVWNPNSDTKITYEQHPYHTDAPDFHKNPHWHLDTPGQPHQRYLPGDSIP